MDINKLKVMLSFMREINDGNMPTHSDYELEEVEFYDIVDACQDNGLIKGVKFWRDKNKKIVKMDLENVKLTVNGMEYLNEHSGDMKTYKGLKELSDWITF